MRLKLSKTQILFIHFFLTFVIGLGFVLFDLTQNQYFYEVTELQSANVKSNNEKVEIPLENPVFGSEQASGQIRIYRSKWDQNSKNRISAVLGSQLIVHADDCVVEVKINGNLVDLNHLSSYQKCDWRKGVTIDLSNLERIGVIKGVIKGVNEIEVSTLNLGGNYSLFLRKNENFRLGVLFLFSIFALFLSYSFQVAWKSFRIRHQDPFRSSQQEPSDERKVSIQTKSESYKFLFHSIVFSIHLFFLLFYVLIQSPFEVYLFSDMEGYYRLAQDWVLGERTPWMFFQSGFFIALTGWVLSVSNYTLIPLQWFTVLTVSCGSLILVKSSESFMGKRGSAILHLLLALHLPWYTQSGILMPDALYTGFLLFLLTSFFWISHSKDGWNSYRNLIVLGIFSGLGLLLKMPHLFFAFFIPFLIQRRGISNLKRSLSFMIAMGLPLLFHGIAVQKVGGEFSLSPLSGGLNFVEGKCPEKVHVDNRGASFQSPLHFQLGENSKKTWPYAFIESHHFRNAAVKCISDRPMVLVESLRYVYFLFFDNHNWPSNVGYLSTASRIFDRLFSFFYFPFIFLGFILIIKKKLWHYPPVLASIGLVFSLLFCVWLTKSEMRYRIPFDGAFLLIAVTAISVRIRNPNS